MTQVWENGLEIEHMIMKILFTGGGTMGPVTPLLAVWEAWRASDASVTEVWVGTSKGPERLVVEAQGISFLTLPVARFPGPGRRCWR